MSLLMWIGLMALFGSSGKLVYQLDLVVAEFENARSLISNIDDAVARKLDKIDVEPLAVRPRTEIERRTHGIGDLHVQHSLGRRKGATGTVQWVWMKFCGVWID